MNQKKLHSNIAPEDFNQLVAFFAWLRIVRDQSLTKRDVLEPLNELCSCVDEVKEKFLE